MDPKWHQLIQLFPDMLHTLNSDVLGYFSFSIAVHMVLVIIFLSKNMWERYDSNVTSILWNGSQVVIGLGWYVVSINDNNIYKALEYVELLNNEIEETFIEKLTEAFAAHGL